MTVEQTSRLSAWSRKLGIVLIVIFCFELGTVLVVFPWLDPWSNNWVADFAPWLSHVWDNGFFRGGVSGLGLLNIFISISEAGRLRRSPE